MLVIRSHRCRNIAKTLGVAYPRNSPHLEPGATTVWYAPRPISNRQCSWRECESPGFIRSPSQIPLRTARRAFSFGSRRGNNPGTRAPRVRKSRLLGESLHDGIAQLGSPRPKMINASSRMSRSRFTRRNSRPWTSRAPLVRRRRGRPNASSPPSDCKAGGYPECPIVRRSTWRNGCRAASARPLA